MSEFSLCGSSYSSQSVNAAAQMCMNFYLERIEVEDSERFVNYPTPGKRLAYDLGSISPIRGEYTLNGRTFTVSGTILWELLANGTQANRGSVVSDGKPVSFAGGPTQVLLASAGVAYVFDTKLNTLSDISAQIANVLMVGYSDGFFSALLINANGLGVVQDSAINDATVWPGDSVTGVSVFTDTPNAIFLDHRELWVFGPKAIQPYALTGASPFPYEVINGAFIESGLAAPFSIAKLDNSLFWLGADERGQGVVRRANGYQAVRVSNHAIEFAIQGYATISDAVGYGYQDQGHEFYVLNFPTANKTWVYDAATAQWHERGFWNIQSGTFTRNLAQYHTFNFGKHLVGDPTSAKIYEQSVNILDDNGSSIRRVRRAAHITDEERQISYNKLQVYLETGLATFDASLSPTTYIIQSTTGALWAVGMSDLGELTCTHITKGDPVSLIVNSQLGTSWNVIVTDLGENLGQIELTQAFTDDYQLVVQFVSFTGTLLWNMQVEDFGSGLAQFQTFPQGKCKRGPLMMLRYSKDGGHTWSKEQAIECGQLGLYQARAIVRRMGTSRNRVFEVSMTDPVPWRIVNSYLDAA